MDLPEKPKILVVTVNWLGDAVMTFPAFSALKSAFPGCRTSVLTVPRLTALYEMDPAVDDVITFDERGLDRSLAAKIRFIRRLKAEHFDLAFFIHRSFTRMLLCALAGIPARCGYARWKTALLLTKKINPFDGLIHRQDHYLRLFEQCGIKITDRVPRLSVVQQEVSWAEDICHRLRRDADFLVGMNPSANWELKRWPLEKYSLLADRLTGEMRCRIVLVGASQDKLLVDACQAKMQGACENLCGKTTLKQLAAILGKLDLFISNDSGPAHLAAALNVPTLALFGPTSEQITGPRGRAVTIITGEAGCPVPCYARDCRDNFCMRAISVEKVYDSAARMLSSHG